MINLRCAIRSGIRYAVLNVASAGTRFFDFTSFRHGQLLPFGMSRVCLLPRYMNAQRGEGRSLRFAIHNFELSYCIENVMKETDICIAMITAIAY